MSGAIRKEIHVVETEATLERLEGGWKQAPLLVGGQGSGGVIGLNVFHAANVLRFDLETS